MTKALPSFLLLSTVCHAELKLPSVFTDHMVIQQKMENPVWGWDTPNTKVTVTIGAKSLESVASKDGRWEVKLPAMDASYDAKKISIKGTSEKVIQDVLIGEVWVCSGQSNMQWPMRQTWRGEVELMAADLPGVRLLTIPIKGTQEPQYLVKGEWAKCTPQSAKEFSAVGYHYGRYLHEILDVPVGLIDNAWGGSAAEAWVKRESIESNPGFVKLMNQWKKKESYNMSPEAETKWKKAATKWDQENPNPKSRWSRPRSPESILTGRNRPGNIWSGMVEPILGYGIKGVIWYQGESNASRAQKYAELFPFLITDWRKNQGQGNFPFYWVQLADFRWQDPNPQDSAWAELRESQTKTLSLPNTGQAVIIDLGEGNDIHPRDKSGVAQRLVRWALTNDYGKDIEAQSPTYKTHSISESEVTLTFDHVGNGLRLVDSDNLQGFAICGADKKWFWAKGKITNKDTIKISADQVKAPIAVRYAWADNPLCNVHSKNGLPLTPFRTDDFPLTTAGK